MNSFLEMIFIYFCWGKNKGL